MKITEWIDASMMHPGAMLRPKKHMAERGAIIKPERHHAIRKSKTRIAADSEDASDDNKKFPDKDFIESVKELMAESTAPCGCTLKVGETVIVEGAGKGKILARENRVLTVELDGKKRQFDQNFVHHPRK